MQDVKSTNFTLRLPNDLRGKLEERAEKERRSIGNLIIFILKEDIEKNGKQYIQ